MSNARGPLAFIAGVLAIVSLVAGGALLYVRNEVLNRSAFENRAVTAVQKPAVRSVVADQIVDAVIQRGDPDLITARPLLESTANAVIATPQFASLIRVAADEAYRTLFAGDGKQVQIEVDDTAALLLTTARSVDPELAKRLPTELHVPLATVTRKDLLGGAVEFANKSRSVPLWLLPLGLVLLLLSIVLAPVRRRAVAGLGLGFSALSVLLAVLVESRPQSAGPGGIAASKNVDEALDQAWNAFAGDLRTWAFTAMAAGLLVVAIASWSRPLPARWRTALAWFVAPSLGVVSVLRGLALGGVGAALLFASHNTSRVVAIVIGVALILAGIDDFLPAPRAVPRSRRSSLMTMAVDYRRWLLGAIACAIAGTTLAAILIRDARTPDHGPGKDNAANTVVASGKTCNGLATLCDRRINEVFFPGTHNSMSAADHPSWLFTNQLYDIPEQLSDGIRLLLIDAHWGVQQGKRVRTDLVREGSSRNRAAKALGINGVRIAEQLAGRVGLGSLKGKRSVWLCHSLCELGATPMDGTLEALRDFLDVHPRDLVVIQIENSVSPQAIQAEFAGAQLIPRIAVLSRDAPLPTLGALLDAHKQLIVLGDKGTGDVPWFLPQNSFVQDTPVDATSCELRAGTVASPMLMINHWIDSFPPRPSLAVRTGTRRRLLDRIRECERVRGLPVAFMAVDYYERTKILQVADEINSEPPDSMYGPLPTPTSVK